MLSGKLGSVSAPMMPVSGQETDMRLAGRCRGSDVGLHPEDRTQQITGQHGPGCTVGNDAARLEHDDPVAEYGGEVQIVQRDDARQVEVAHHAQDPDLIMDVEMVGRFIQKEYAWRLRQCAGNVDALLLATREGLPELRPPPLHVDAGQRRSDRRLVRRGPAREGGAVRRPPQPHHVADRDIGVGRSAQLDEGQLLRQCPVREARDVLPVNLHRARPGRFQPGE